MHIQEQRWHYGRRFLITTEGASAHLEIYTEPARDARVQAYFGALWVEPAYRRKGIARRILHTAEELAKLNGQDAVWLEWRESDTPVEIARWYEREGYNDVEFGGGYALYKKSLKGGEK